MARELALEQVGDGGKCQQKAQDQQRESDQRDTAHSDGPSAPAPFKNAPGQEPNENGGGGDAREGSRRPIEVENAVDVSRLVGGQGQDSQSERPDAGGKNGGRARTVGQGWNLGRSYGIRGIHFSAPRLS